MDQSGRENGQETSAGQSRTLVPSRWPLSPNNRPQDSDRSDIDFSAGDEAAAGDTVAIGLIDIHCLSREALSLSLHARAPSFDITPWPSCEAALNGDAACDLFLYHVQDEELNQENGSVYPGFEQLVEFAPVIILCSVEEPEHILAAFEKGARGYIPVRNTSVDIAVEIIRLVKAGGAFVPIDSLPLLGAAPRRATGAINSSERLTPREKEVLSLIKTGKANKIIAHELQVSESTIKVHIHNILRKLKVCNRTEAACRAHVPTFSQRPSST